MLDQKFNSRELIIVTRHNDAEALLNYCVSSGAEIACVVPASSYPHSSSLAANFENGRTEQWTLKFEGICGPGVTEIGKPEITLTFEGIASNVRWAMIYPGRAYCSRIDMESSVTRKCWGGLERLIKETFGRVTLEGLTPKGKFKNTSIYIGPAAQEWLKEPNHRLFRKSGDDTELGLEHW